jgi:ribosome biogenesis protein BRX1
LIKIFDGSFGGPVLYSNPHYVSPNKHRHLIKKSASEKYNDRVLSKKGKEMREPKGDSYKDVDKYDDVFDTISPEDAKGIVKNVFNRKKQ